MVIVADEPALPAPPKLRESAEEPSPLVPLDAAVSASATPTASRPASRPVTPTHVPTVVRPKALRGEAAVSAALQLPTAHDAEAAALALDTFKANRSFYHPIAAKMLAKDLGLE